jgi:hypothetical protein
MAGTPLPPLVGKIIDGSITWQRLDKINYEVLGYFLSCHLIIEHYLDEYLKISYPSLDWDAARHTFSQKVALLSNFKISEKYDCIPALKHLNSLRNKLSHNIAFKIETKHLLPLSRYLTKACDNRSDLPKDTEGILRLFTLLTCSLFGGTITGAAKHAKARRQDTT